MKPRVVSVSFEMETGQSAVRIREAVQCEFPTAENIEVNVIRATKPKRITRPEYEYGKSGVQRRGNIGQWPKRKPAMKK